MFPLTADEEMNKTGESSALDKSNELPHANVMTLGNECFHFHEVLFQAILIGMECAGVHDIGTPLASVTLDMHCTSPWQHCLLAQACLRVLLSP